MPTPKNNAIGKPKMILEKCLLTNCFTPHW